MYKPLVSIITPCFNGEAFLHRYFISILNQTYNNIELIFVNDGSIDNTETIALSYRDKFKEKGIKYLYIYQKKAGQAAAINKGLSLFSGEYLTWPDSDDFMASDCIEKKVAFLEEHKEYGFLLCKTAIVNETNVNKVIGYYYRKNVNNDYIFDDLVFINDIYFAPGGYMVRSKAFLECIPSKKIYECKTGQNWQMLLPISYSYKCGFLNEVLYYYVVRKDSHSRQEKTYEDKIERTFRHQDTLAVTIESIINMSAEDKASFIRRIDDKYLLERFEISCQYHKNTEIDKYYLELNNRKLIDRRIRKKYLRGKNRLVDFYYIIIDFSLRVIRKITR